MRKTLIILFSLFALGKQVTAQDFPYGKVTLEEMNMKRYDKDTSAHAVVLQEYGRSNIDVVNDDLIKLTYEYHVKIKIFDTKGFDNATAELGLGNNDNSETDEVETLEGVTYYTDETGGLQKAELDKANVFTTRDDKYQSTYKFTMPALRTGCVIEYKYTLTSPIDLCLHHFRAWFFQSDIPKINSEYEAVIPGHFSYNAVLHGYLKLTKNKPDILKDCFSTHGAKSDCSDIIYGMADIPAFVAEEYMTAPRNYFSAITFDLVEYTNPYTGEKTRVTTDWNNIDQSLKNSFAFGSQLKKKDILNDRMVPVLAGKTTDLDKAKAIYAYIQRSFKWNNDYEIYSESVKKGLEAHTGSIADINLALVVALSGTGIDAKAVLTSTRDNGFVNEVYPATNDFNYVIAKVTLDGQVYFLDASEPLLSFGMLPLRCLNGKGRVFSLDKPSEWTNLDLPQKEKSNCTIDLTLQDDGKLKGTITNFYMGYEAYEKRVEIKKFNTVDEYVEDQYAKMPKIKIIKSSISNVDSLDMPVVEKYDVEINIADDSDVSSFSFNPFFLSKISENPFKLADRSYPVDMGMPSDDRIVMTIKYPPQFTVASAPQNVSMGLPNNGGQFLTEYEPGDNSFTFSHVIQFNKSIYNPAEYPYLKEFYNKIIQSEKAEMIFKKK